MSATGPFTVMQQRCRVEHDALCDWRDQMEPVCNCGAAFSKPEIVYREAFATLEEARAAMRRIVTERLPFDTAEGIKAVIDARIANASFLKRPLALPNGDVIEVEAVTYERLWDDLTDRPPFIAGVDCTIWVGGDGVEDARWGAAILAAWNAEHGIGLDGSA